MAKYELNIYCKNNEIENMDVREKFEMINSFVKRMFIGLSDDELNRASGDDVINLFNQLIRKGRSIVSSKNPTAAGK